ncbi:hypothetical protein [Proteus alimentorum]|uniref:endonuclease toxin domain-containing protein n=1 Tax=Proteus alimentorum TaxID=1973495 RepID=UPI0030B7FC38
MSVKTLNTQTASRIENPRSIENTLNTYISKIDSYNGERKGSMRIMPEQIKQKTIELGIPENTNKE